MVVSAEEDQVWRTVAKLPAGFSEVVSATAYARISSDQDGTALGVGRQLEDCRRSSRLANHQVTTSEPMNLGGVIYRAITKWLRLL